MKNTIEKALQKQKEAKAAKQSEIVEEKLEDTVQSNIPEDSKVTIDKPSSSELEPPAEPIVAEEKEFTNTKSPTFKVPLEVVEVTLVTVGTTPSMTRALLAPNEFA